MKLTTLSLMAGGLLALTTTPWSPDCQAQVAVTQTTTAEPALGTISEFTPASETLVIKSETAPAPIRYSVTKQTTYVDEAGAPVVVEKITPGTPISVRYVREGDRLVASRIVVRRAAPVVEHHTTTTTTTTRKLTDDEKDRLEDIRENQKERREELREREKDRRDHDRDDD